MNEAKKEVLTTYQAGVIGVDAGLCWIGDPCYVIHREKSFESLGEDWDEFCAGLSLGVVVKQFDYDMGHPGLGMCISTGYGDGVYPVLVTKNSEGRVVRVTIEFVSYEDEEAIEDGDELNVYELCPLCQCSTLPEELKEGKCPACTLEGGTAA